jgi:hypothetical protein
MDNTYLRSPYFYPDEIIEAFDDKVSFNVGLNFKF